MYGIEPLLGISLAFIPDASAVIAAVRAQSEVAVRGVYG
jgi:hypothetical protein